jgi:acetyl esterase/lipase
MMKMQRVLVLLCSVLAATACGAEGPAPTELALQIYDEVPDAIDPSARYLIYLHGAIIERAGVRPTHPKFGTYEYRKILEAFADRGLVVISEARPEGTDGMLYAATVADQVRELLAAEVPPEHITVVGFSKGGGIAIATSSMLANDDLNFVFVAACNPWLDSRPEIIARGRLLSLRESSDDLADSCEGLFERSPSRHDHQEILLELGGGHGAFYRPQPEWLNPALDWAAPDP